MVPSRPGGGYDRYSRLIQPFLEKRLDAQIIIVNRTEAGGIVGALLIENAKADGKTLGIVNASGLLAANALHDGRAPNPLQDFSILGRVVSNRMVILTGQASGIDDIDALLELAAIRPLVVGVRDIGSASFFALPVTASLLDVEYSVVSGYVGSTSRVLAAIRGEVDIIIQNYDSISSYVESKDLRPLLEISGTRPSVPPLGGRDGVAARIAAEHKKSVDDAIEQADALAAIMSAGRLVVAPAGLPATLEACLQESLMEVLMSTEFTEAAERAGLSIEAVGSTTAKSDLMSSERSLAEFESLVRSAVEKSLQ